MPKDPNRMYSVAISNYIQFLSIENDRINTYEDSLYEMIVEETLTEFTTMAPFTTGPKPPAKLLAHSATRYERNPKIGAQAIQLAQFRCHINSNHQFFQSKRTHENYVEAHHLIPIAFQGLFSYGIDEVENIVTLCPVCHRQIHYAEDYQRKEMIHSLHAAFSAQLQTIGIELSKKELLSLYDIT